jgi:hypothetical protein
VAYNDKSKKTVQYLSRDFAENRQSLINFIKTYFPNQLNDFSEASPQGALLESIAYLGDVLNFQMDVTLAESLLTNVEERVNLYNLARGHGYVPRTVTPASVELEIFQLLPAIGSGNQTQPDFRYGLYIEPNMQVSTTDTDAINFRTVDAVDFRFSSSYDPTTITTYSVTGDGSIEYYLAKKKVKAVSGELKTATFSFSDPKQYDKIVIQDNNVTEIVDVTDSDGNKWYEVQFLAQDTVQQSIRNLPYNDPQLSQYRSSVPYILSYKQTERRFVTRLRKDDFTELQFGGGMSSEADEEILPNPMNVGLGLNYFERAADVSIDPQNFLYSKTYGSAPQNTVLTIRYAVANGLRENVNSNTITAIVTSTIVDPGDSTDPTVLQTIKDSLSINNPFPAFGGQNRKPLEIIREEAIANFAAQNRAVTREDLILRCFTMPAKYGAICQVYAEQDTQMASWNSERIPNPFSINLYCLSYDSNKNFVACNEAIKENLRTHLRSYRMMTDAISIKDPWIINFSVEVEIIVRPNENSNEVILRTVNRLIEIFDNDRQQINAPIIISNLTSQLDVVPGVQSVVSIKFLNQIDTAQGYSGNVYDFPTATRGGVIYPPLDPAIFECRYPKRDIRVRAIDI